jgi:hypothetical protein
MQTTANGAAVFDLRWLNVQALDDEELVAIGGGTDPVSVGCALALGGVTLVLIGVVFGVAVYALMN